MFSRYALLTLATVAASVNAHGSLNYAMVDDIYVPGPDPNSGNQGQFAIREINDINPVKGADNQDLFCGHGSTPAALTVDAHPGSVLQFAWENGEKGTWVHNTGPVMTYMASCGAGGCANFDDHSAEFFKISELGKHDDGTTWFMADLTTGPNATTSATIPSSLPDGEYLVRHELIALQLGMSEGGAEFYPACLQVNLRSNSNGTTTQSTASLPSGNQVATFPGGYSDTDPGIFDPHVYDGASYPYTFPGPPLVSDAVNDPSADPSTDIPGNVSSTPTSSAADTAPTSNPCGNMSKKKKRVVKRVLRQGSLVKKSHQVVRKAVEAEQRPVARSRIMRAI